MNLPISPTLFQISVLFTHLSTKKVFFWFAGRFAIAIFGQISQNGSTQFNHIRFHIALHISQSFPRSYHTC